MRRLKTLNRDTAARREVNRAWGSNQSGDNMDFGLLCFERGREAGRQEAREELLALADQVCPNSLAFDGGKFTYSVDDVERAGHIRSAVRTTLKAAPAKRKTQ